MTSIRKHALPLVRERSTGATLASGIVFALLLSIGVASSAPAAALLAGGAIVLAGAALPLGLRRVRRACPLASAALCGNVAAIAAGCIWLFYARPVWAFYAYAAIVWTGYVQAIALSGPAQASAQPTLAWRAWVRGHVPLLATAAALLLVWGMFWLAFYPGMMSPDSLSEWTQATTLQLSDFSPAVYTLFIWTARTLWPSPASVSLLQILLSVGLLATLAQQLARQGLPRWVLAGIVAVYLFLPIFGTFTVTLWHDILYSLMVLWMTHAMYLMYRSRGEWLAPRFHRIALGMAMVLLPFFAHNGLSVVAGVLFFAWASLRRYRRKVLGIAAGVLAGFVLVQYAVYPAIGVQPYSKAFASEALIHQISAAISEHQTLNIPAPDLRFLEAIMPLRNWRKNYEPYTPANLVSLRFNPNYNETPIDQHFGEFLRIWAEIGLRYPGAYIGERISENALILRPTGDYKIALSPLRIAPNSLGLRTKSLAPPVLAILREVNTWTINNTIWLWRPFWVMWLLFALTIAGAALRGKGVLFVAVPWIFQVLGLAISIQGQSVRYYYSLFLIAPYFVGLLCLPYMQGVHWARLSGYARPGSRGAPSADGAGEAD